MAKEIKFKVPKLISMSDQRIAKFKRKKKKSKNNKKNDDSNVVYHQQLSSTTMFFNYNQQLGPPFRIICDTNFINFSIKNKLDIVTTMMDCLLAKCIPIVTDCIVGELQKLGAKYRVALRIVKQNFERLPCTHRGTYADDCIVDRIRHHKCFIVGTCDRGLKRRIRKIPGVPIMYIVERQYSIERMPDAYGCKR